MQYYDCQMHVPGSGIGFWDDNSKPTGTPWRSEVPERTSIATVSSACPAVFTTMCDSVKSKEVNESKHIIIKFCRTRAGGGGDIKRWKSPEDKTCNWERGRPVSIKEESRKRVAHMEKGSQLSQSRIRRLRMPCGFSAPGPPSAASHCYLGKLDTNSTAYGVEMRNLSTFFK